MTRLPLFDPRPGNERHRAEIEAALRRVLDSGRLVLGPEVEAFEREFSAWVGAAHGVGVNSGTDAITLALRAVDVGAGDEVLTVANAGAPPVAAIRAAGAVPRFVDVDPATLLVDPAALAAAIGPRVRAVVPVHLYGQPAPLAAILEPARRAGIPVIEDCAQAHGARLDGRHVGAWGAVGCFSFYPTKNLGALGDGGLCVTDDPDLAARIRRLRMYGFDNDRSSIEEGVNSRLDELQAALLRVKLRGLDELLDERRRIAAGYRRALAGVSGVAPLDECPGVEHAMHLFVVRCAERAAVAARLDAAGVGWGVHYPVAAHLMPAYRRLGGGEGSLPVTEAACAEVLSLPLYAGMPGDAPTTVAAALETD